MECTYAFELDWMCDKSLSFGKKVHSAANTETGEEREARSAGAAVLAFISPGFRSPVRQKLTDLSTHSYLVSQDQRFFDEDFLHW
jgi:hypothetical protein